MKKSIIIQSALVLAVLSTIWSCKDSFLDLNPQGSISNADLSNEIGVENALIGAYSMLDGYNLNDQNQWTADPVNWIMGSVPSDEAYKGSEQGDIGEITEIETYQWSAGNSMLNQRWLQYYEGIKRCNSTIVLLTDTEGIPSATAQRIEGEARFLRAYYHFELFKAWGNVPYYTDEDLRNNEFNKSNENVDPLGDAIADVQEAVNLLPDEQADGGRVNKKAAQAYLGKLLLYNGDHAGAKTQFDPVVNSTSLAPCLRDLFHTTTENHEEALFSVQMSASTDAQARNGNWLNQLAYPQDGGFGCCGFHQPSQNLVNSYKVDANGLPLLDDFNDSDLDPENDVVDPRLDLTVGRDDVPYLDRGYHSPTWIRSREYSGPYSPKKNKPFSTEPIPGGGWNGAANNGVNVPIIRLGDVILMLAECEVELGNLDRAEELVNMIRERAGNCAQGPIYQIDNYGTPSADTLKDADGNYQIVNTGADAITDDLSNPEIGWATYDVQEYPAGTFTANGADFAREAVQFERKLELALEGHRFADLQRWGVAAEVLNQYIAEEQSKRPYLASAATYAEKHRWFPIPTIQIQLSRTAEGQALQQNPGW